MFVIYLYYIYLVALCKVYICFLDAELFGGLSNKAFGGPTDLMLK